MTRDDVIQKLKSRPFYVFGTGYVAEMFWIALERLDLTQQITGFLTTTEDHPSFFHGKPVFRMDEVSFADDEWIVAAVHETVYRGISFPKAEVLWIYPWLHGLLFGDPIRECLLRLEDIRKAQEPDQYWIAARYAGVLAYDQSDEGQKELYLKAMECHCSPETAKRRFLSLGDLLSSMRRRGFEPDRPVYLTEDLEVIDGLHRIAVSAYLGIREIPCRIYPSSDIFCRIFTEKNTLPLSVLVENGFCEEELNSLRKWKEIVG